MIFAEQVAQVHSYLHAKNYLVESPYQGENQTFVKNQFLLNSSFTPIDMALVLKSRKYPKQAKL